MTDYECAVSSTQAYPDDMEKWPRQSMEAAKKALDRLLEQHPNSEVIATKSFCMGRDHERFPDNVPPNITHFLVYQVTVRERAA